MFFKVKTSEEVFEMLKGFEPVGTETVYTGEAVNRVLSEEIVAGEDLPEFQRSTVDGYAVRARDTFGASESLPALLELSGEVVIGRAPTDMVGPGSTVKIPTGGMVPDGADAVVMLEYCHGLDEKTIEVNRAVSPLENVIRPGDDLKKGTLILETGSVLRPQDIGILAGLGVQHIESYRKPRVAIVSTGDEVIPIDQRPLPGQVRDINSYTLKAFCIEAGAVPVNLGLCRDNFSDLREMAARALETSDTLWISGGSSVGTRDMTLSVLESFDGMEVLAHGVAVSPGKPTIIARFKGKAVFGLPGHVASAMVVAEVFLHPFLSRLSGQSGVFGDDHFYQQAELGRNIESATGRDDYIRVRLTRRDGRYFAEPVFGKSGLISTLVEADGLVKIDRNTEGLYEGQTVSVMLFKPFKARA